jgi:hypothetical protein
MFKYSGTDRDAISEWIAKVHFPIVIHITFASPRGPYRSIPTDTQGKIGQYLRFVCTLSKKHLGIKISLASLGIIVLKASGHLHSHLLTAEKSGQTLVGIHRIMEIMWHYKHRSLIKVEQTRSRQKVIDYVFSPKHMYHSAESELFCWGTSILDRLSANQKNERFIRLPNFPVSKLNEPVIPKGVVNGSSNL